MILSIDEVNEILDRAYGEFPDVLFHKLNGGVLLLEETKAGFEAGKNLYTMGEYCVDEMGRYIKIYYGSFVKLLSDEPREVWEDELRFVLRHELTHHVEGLAGDRSLEYKDSAQMDAYRRDEPWDPDEYQKGRDE